MYRCETGYIGTRCEYLDLAYHVEERRKIVIACVVAGLVFLIVLIVFICVCTQWVMCYIINTFIVKLKRVFFNLECFSLALFHSKRYKPCRKKKTKKQTSDEDEKLNSLNTHEALAAPVDTSDTNAVWSECVYLFSCLIQFTLTMWCIRATYCLDHVNQKHLNGSWLRFYTGYELPTQCTTIIVYYTKQNKISLKINVEIDSLFLLVS